MTSELLDLTGIGKERLHLAWVSSAEAQRFAQIATDVTQTVQSLGPFDPGQYALELDAAEMTVNGEIVRWLVGKQVNITTQGDVYGRTMTDEKYASVMGEALEREYHKNLIYLSLQQGCSSVREIGAHSGLDLVRISYLLSDMEKTGRVEFKAMENRKPVFAAV